MRLVTYRERDGDGRDRVGVVEGDRVHDLVTLGVETRDLLSFIRDGASVLHEIAPGDAAGVALADVQLRPPIPHPPRNVVCVGLNYAEHVAESQSAAGAGAPQHPVFFTKPPQTVIGPDDEIPWHDTVTRAVDWEVELAVVIGREGRDISEGEALDYVFGYTVANDITARDLQARHQQWYKGKGLDGYCPLGPMVVTAGEIGRSAGTRPQPASERRREAALEHPEHDLRRGEAHRRLVGRHDPGARRHPAHRYPFGHRCHPAAAGVPAARRRRRG